MVCNPANYNKLSANVIHRLSLMHPLVMLNCVQKLTCKHHLIVTKISNNEDDNQNTNKIEAHKFTCKDDKVLQPCQLQ